jgi:hypothetical protein
VVKIQKNEILDQIANLKKEIMQLNKIHKSREVSVKEEIKNKCNNKINELKTNFQDELANLDEINNQIKTFKEKEKNVQNKLKSISKEITKISDQRDHNIKIGIKKEKQKNKKAIKEINKKIRILEKKL